MLWTEAKLPYDPEAFWGGPGNEDLVFIGVDVTFARLLGPGFERVTWRP